MRAAAIYVSSLLAVSSQAANILLSNDDGWAEKNVRVLYDALAAAGHNVVLSAPAKDRSGTGSSDAPPTVVTDGCQYDSCPNGSYPVGCNASEPRLNYVNSYPATSMRYGLLALGERFFGARGLPDLALAGINVGANTGPTTKISGTVGAAVESSLDGGPPAIAFSGTTGAPAAWTTATQTHQSVYAALSLNLTQTLLLASNSSSSSSNSSSSSSSGKKAQAQQPSYLPPKTWLNVNYSPVGGGNATSNSSRCSSASDFRFVLTRIASPTPEGQGSPPDVETCGSVRLPTESEVMRAAGCYASVSVGNASTKLDAAVEDQAFVLGRLESILSCLPG